MADRRLVSVPPHTLTVTHVCDGENVVVGGEDGQTWVGTFAAEVTAQQFCEFMKVNPHGVYGERSVD